MGQSRASAAIVNESLDIEPGRDRALLRVPNADIAVATVLQLFEAAPPKSGPGIHLTAAVDATAIIGENAVVGAGCYIGPGVIVGANTRLYPNVTVLDESSIGGETVIRSGRLYANVAESGMAALSTRM